MNNQIRLPERRGSPSLCLPHFLSQYDTFVMPHVLNRESKIIKQYIPIVPGYLITIKHHLPPLERVYTTKTYVAIEETNTPSHRPSELGQTPKTI